MSLFRIKWQREAGAAIHSTAPRGEKNRRFASLGEASYKETV